ncbi:MAG: methyltransferase domain-containing protein [Candidatus Eremiobacteraeota bacterium]|nr:methyltransferase domain-containing protein [Candidatus Eremiobacteraeota bacterium]MBC5803247.1 methyltransferase domain-containing protein [Candidatus Eremiobacteraeota bacterium]MBC5822268.1 methyltransferase domain-containing protein [Candidatus Eremiobacteraeota bacterium]
MPFRPGDPSLGAAYFERLYAADSDPWNFASSPYESEKYGRTIEALGERRFARALEVGCSIGVLSERLAERCDRLLSIDINPRALAAAKQRCAALTNVTFAEMNVPHDFPTERFDLIVVSEVAYYWSDDDLALAIDAIAGASAGGTVELVHFLPKVQDYARDGDAVHHAFLRDRRFVRTSGMRADRYRIDVLTCRAEPDFRHGHHSEQPNRTRIQRN